MLLVSMPYIGVIGAVFFGILAVILIPYIFYLLTLQNTLKAVRPQNRTLEPGLVWLMLIPLFNLVWQFIVVTRVSDSLANEYRSRGMELAERPAYNVGIAYCICLCCSWIPFIGFIGSIAGIVLWIVYWVKVNEYKTRLTGLPLYQEQQERSIFDA